MYIHKYVINEPPRGSMWLHRRIFIRWNTKTNRDEDAREILGGHIEFVLRRPNIECALGIEVGTRGSETPFDGRITLFGQALYWGINQGNALAEAITQRWLTRMDPKTQDQIKYEGRTLDAYIYSRDLPRGHADLVWNLWTPKNHGLPKKIASWRQSRLDLNLLNHIQGRPKYSYTDVQVARIWLDFDEGSYPVKATLKRQIYGRPKSNRCRESWCVDVDASEAKGVPDHLDHSGGWKGDRVWGFGVNLPTYRPDWHVDAKALIEAHVLQSRARTGFREPQPLED